MDINKLNINNLCKLVMSFWMCKNTQYIGSDFKILLDTCFIIVCWTLNKVVNKNKFQWPFDGYL